MVKVVALGHAFVDGTQFDLSAGLSNAIKSIEDVGVANDGRMSAIGPDTQRSLLMAWMTHFAKLCPNVVGVDFTRVRSLKSCHALGFTNLAQVIGPRGGWFKPPLRRDFYFAAVAVHYPDGPKKRIKRRKPAFVTAINWSKKTIDIYANPANPARMCMAQMQDMVAGGPKELAKWSVGRVHFGDEARNTSGLDNVDGMAFVLGIPQDSRVFDIDPRRLAPTSSYSLETTSLANALAIRSRAASNCTALNLHNANEKMIVTSCKGPYHQLIADLAPLKSSPWITVSLLHLGTPMFTPLNWLDSLFHLATFAAGFPNVTALTLHTYFPAVADVLLACDPFLRRPPSAGRPLRQLSVLRACRDPKRPELKRAPNGTGMQRTQLDMTRATPYHLERLVLGDSGLLGDHAWWTNNPILIHPGLLHGIKYANLMGAHVAVAPPRLATPDSDSFPSALALRRKENPILLAHVTLPNLHMLAVNGDLAHAGSQTPDASSLAQVLPSCPNLESLMIDLDYSPYLYSWLATAHVICKYPRVRNVCISCVTLDESQLVGLADHLFAHPIRALRPIPTLDRVVLVNQPARAQELTGLWVAGPRSEPCG